MINLILADSDADYISGISRYISRICYATFNISLFTSEDSFRSYLKDHMDEPDVIVASEDMLQNGCAEKFSGMIIALSESFSRENDTDGTHYHRLRKFQQADRLVSEIVDILSEHMEIFRTRPTASGRVKVIVMCSPSGGSGTSLLCATLARCIADLGNKVVYLNFEAIPSTETFFTGDGSQYNFSDVLFCLKSGRKNIGSKADLAKSYSIHDHIGYFMAQNCFLEIDELEDTDCMKLIRCFRDDPGCDAVVIDAGSGINRKTTAMMRAADRIGIVLNGDPVAALKNKMFEDQFGMIFDQSENMPSRITIFHNRREERLPDSGSSSRLFSSCAFVHNIPYIPDVWQKPNDEAFRYESMNSLRTALTEAAVQMMEKTSAETRTVFAGKK